MSFEIYEYKPTNDGKLEKVVYETLEDLNPSDADTPFEYLNRYIAQKRIAFERANNEIIEKWHSYVENYFRSLELVKEELKIRGYDIDHLDFKDVWEINSPVLKYMADNLCQAFVLTFGNTEAFLNTDLMKNAPEDIKEEFRDITSDEYYTWLQYMTNAEATRPVRPVLLSDTYEKFDLIEAKNIIVTIRDKFVRNNEDSMADALKLCSFLAGAIRRIYNVLPEESKNKLSAVDRNILDYGFKFQSELQTRCDSELADEGLGVIKKLLERESTINDIILLVYSHLKA